MSSSAVRRAAAKRPEARAPAKVPVAQETARVEGVGVVAEDGLVEVQLAVGHEDRGAGAEGQAPEVRRRGDGAHRGRRRVEA